MSSEICLKVPDKLFCEKCDYTCCRLGDFKKHLATRKHETTTSDSSKISEKLFCAKCHYTSSNTRDFNKHLNTAKHTRTTSEKSKVFSCNKCNREYKHHSSLWKHQNTCNIEAKGDTDVQSLRDVTMELIKNNTEDKESWKTIVMELVKSNSDLQKQSNDLQKQVIELCKNGTVNNTTNNNNNRFNINMFLNEKCRDAINLSDFIQTLEVSREDLENTGRLGFVDGISKIIMDHLKQLDVSERPIHCTDVKRETLYIKDENEWKKDEDTENMNRVIQAVSRNSVRTLQDWKENNPDYIDGDSDFSRSCITMQLNSLAGDKRNQLYPKVVKIIAKKVAVDKEQE